MAINGEKGFVRESLKVRAQPKASKSALHFYSHSPTLPHSLCHITARGGWWMMTTEMKTIYKHSVVYVLWYVICENSKPPSPTKSVRQQHRQQQQQQQQP